MRKITVAILALVLVGMLMPAGFSSDTNSVVITYGETTHVNSEYKNIVDNFFKNYANVDLNSAETKIITASDVNAVSSSITGKTYSSDQIFSSALVNLKDSGNIDVYVDTSKITTITADMYKSALDSAGITHGSVYVTSPVTATGESALAGIMNSYEVATNVEIPEKVKEAANDEIYTQAEIVNNSGVDPDKLSNLVSEVKDTVSDRNVTDHAEIVNIINNHVQTNNINITNSDIENLANSIEQVQNVQGDVNDYKDKVSGVFNNSTGGGFSLDSLFNWIHSIFS